MREDFGSFTRRSDGVIALRPLNLDDVPAVTEACQDEEMVRWTASIPSPYREQHAIDWISGLDEKWRTGRVASFAVVEHESDELLGNVSLSARDWSLRHGVVGYWVKAASRSRGVATRALLALSAWAFDELEFEELHLETLLGNLASERVAQKGGFAFVDESLGVRIPTRPDRTFDLKRWRRGREASC